MCWSLEDPALHWKSHQRQEPLLCPRVLQGWETKGRWWKVSLTPLNPYTRHGRACILCQLRVGVGWEGWGTVTPPPPLTFPPSAPQSALLFLYESLCSSWCWCFGIEAEYWKKPGRVVQQLTTTSIATQYVCPDAVHMGSEHVTDALDLFFSSLMFYVSVKKKNYKTCAWQSWGEWKKKKI